MIHDTAVLLFLVNDNYLHMTNLEELLLAPNKGPSRTVGFARKKRLAKHVVMIFNTTGCMFFLKEKECTYLDGNDSIAIWAYNCKVLVCFPLG